MKLLSVEVAEWIEHLGPHSGDRWFESGPPVFAKIADFFMIFVIYSRPGPGRGMAGNSLNSKAAVLWALDTRYHILVKSLIVYVVSAETQCFNFWSWYQCCQNFQFYLNLVWFLLRMQKISFVFKSKHFWVKCSWKLQLLTFNQNFTKWFKSWLHCQTQLY